MSVSKYERSGKNGRFIAPGRVPADHAEVAVLLDGQWLVRDVALDPAADRAEPTDARVAEPAEHELRRHAAGDHLVVDEVGREPRERQVAATLADDLVARREPDEVGEALDRDRVAIPHELRDGVAHRRDLRRHPAASTPDDGAGVAGRFEDAAGVAGDLSDRVGKDPQGGARAAPR